MRTFEPGVTATIVGPADVDLKRPVELIFYTLPNGNSTAQTIGQRMSEGLDWHFDIQHIGAQTRALRARGFGLDQAIVVYLEADGKSWPAWRAKLGYPKANARLVEIVNSIREPLSTIMQMNVTLTGHSGGGSFMFGFIEGQPEIPNWIGRIAMLDASYNFDGTTHGAKLRDWLRRDPRHRFVSMAYDDREIMLDGKKVVSDSGGTWRATQRMLDYFGSRGIAFVHDTLGPFDRYAAPGYEFLRHPNPANRILHTEMIGEMNGYMHALLSGRGGYDDRSSVLHAKREYGAFVEGAVLFPPAR